MPYAQKRSIYGIRRDVKHDENNTAFLLYSLPLFQYLRTVASLFFFVEFVGTMFSLKVDLFYTKHVNIKHVNVNRSHSLLSYFIKHISNHFYLVLVVQFSYIKCSVLFRQHFCVSCCLTAWNYFRTRCDVTSCDITRTMPISDPWLEPSWRVLYYEYVMDVECYFCKHVIGKFVVALLKYLLKYVAYFRRKEIQLIFVENKFNIKNTNEVYE